MTKLGKAWQSFLEMEAPDDEFYRNNLMQAHSAQRIFFNNPLVGQLPSLAHGLVKKDKDSIAYGVKLIGFLQKPSTGPFLLQPLLWGITKVLPITSPQYQAMKDWVNEGEEGAEFLGILLLFLLNDSNKPDSRLIELVRSFRQKMKAVS